jgi:hypothetical protein
MEWLDKLSYFFGGAFLTNALPHFISGLMGQPLQSPFAKPSGEGYSSSTVNVLWGFFNLVIAYLLLVLVGNFDIHSLQHSLALGLGSLLIAVPTSRHFGKFNGGNHPEKRKASK